MDTTHFLEPRTGLPGWALRCVRGMCKLLLLPAAARQARPSPDGSAWDLRDLDDRMLRDAGIDPSTVARSPRGEHLHLLFTQWLR